MTALPRRPESCEHRAGVGAGESSCELGRRVLGGISPAAVRTDDATCRECCRRPARAGARLNPVVASLVFQAAETGSPAEAATEEFIARHWARQYAMVSVESADGRGGCAGESGADATGGGVRQEPALRREPQRLGLVGPNSRFGLGHVNRDIARHLGIDRWLMVERPGELDAPARNLRCSVQRADLDEGDVDLAAWLRGLDAVLFVETPYFPKLCREARRLGVLVICIPMWEWLHPGLAWLDDVDVMLCPTRWTASLLARWKSQFGFGWAIECVAWPIDPETFAFRRRYRSEQFVYVHGSGGFRALRNGLESEVLERKGLATLLEAAREIPNVPVVVYGHEGASSSVPGNVEFRDPPDDNRDLYAEGDVCVQPSLWEGLGLPLLECQAAGMPLITTDLPPMNEHAPWGVIPGKAVSARLKPDLWIPAAEICPEDLARVMRNCHRRWIPFASGRARRSIVRERNWLKVRGPLCRRISTWVGGDRDAQ